MMLLESFQMHMYKSLKTKEHFGIIEKIKISSKIFRLQFW